MPIVKDGRPLRIKVLSVRLTDREYQQIAKAARKAKTALPQFTREKLLA